MGNVKFTDRSREILDALEMRKLQALEAIGATAELYAKENTPVDTGRLQGSIAHAVRPKENAVYIGTNVEYAPYVELGARGRDPVHMLKKAATEHTDEYRHIAETALGK